MSAINPSIFYLSLKFYCYPVLGKTKTISYLWHLAHSNCLLLLNMWCVQQLRRPQVHTTTLRLKKKLLNIQISLKIINSGKLLVSTANFNDNTKIRHIVMTFLWFWGPKNKICPLFPIFEQNIANYLFKTFIYQRINFMRQSKKSKLLITKKQLKFSSISLSSFWDNNFQRDLRIFF